MLRVRRQARRQEYFVVRDADRFAVVATLLKARRNLAEAEVEGEADQIF